MPTPIVTPPRSRGDSAQCNFCLRYPVAVAHVRGGHENARLAVSLCAECAATIGALVPVLAALPPARVAK